MRLERLESENILFRTTRALAIAGVCSSLVVAGCASKNTEVDSNQEPIVINNNPLGSVVTEPSPNDLCRDELAQYPAGYATAVIGNDGSCIIAIPDSGR